MFASRARLTGVAAVLLCWTAGSLWYGLAAAHRAGAGQSEDSKLKTLLKERLTTLRELAVEIARHHKQGAVSFEEVHEVNEAVLQAELDLAGSPRERIAVLEKLVSEAKRHEEHVARSAKTGAAPTVLVLKVRADRLKAEIALEREKQKQPNRDKR